MEKYLVKSEYRDLWVTDGYAEEPIEFAEIERLSEEWGKPIKELMGQVELYEE
jgi:hypothetical protein